jgi:ComF family protein
VHLLAPLHHVMDFCYPRVCAACDALDSTPSPLCEACFSELEKLATAPACSNCAMPVAMTDSVCPYCQGEGNKPFERIARLGAFRDPLRQMIREMKYQGKWTYAEFLADRLCEQETVKRVTSEADVIVPVPLHPLRHMSRGYNQAEVIARRIGKNFRVKVASPIIRLKNTETQTHLHSRERRFANLRDAFALTQPRKIRDKHVVIVDDVMTSGATLKAVARTISEAEPATICAVVLAIADARRQDFTAI